MKSTQTMWMSILIVSSALLPHAYTVGTISSCGSTVGMVLISGGMAIIHGDD